MAMPDKALLLEHGVINLRDDKKLHCYLCGHKSDPSTNWLSHIEEFHHTGAYRQFRVFFTPNGAERINCKACNTGVDWESFVDHAVWHRIVPWYEIRDKHKTLFENRILRVHDGTAEYACYPCRLKLPQCSSALLHIGEATHVEAITFEPLIHEGFAPLSEAYESLVNDGFVPWGVHSVKCHYCNRPNVSLDGTSEHCADERHLQAKKMFALDFPTLEKSATPVCVSKNAAANNCRAVNGGTSNRAVAVVNNGRSRSIQPSSVRARHNSSSSYKSQTQSSGGKFFSRRSSMTPKSLGEKTFPVERRGDRLWCSICDVNVLTDIQAHEKEVAHMLTLQELGHDEIEPIDGWTYRCKCCDCKVPNFENVFRHIKGIKHREIYARLKARNKTNVSRMDGEGKTTSFKMNFFGANHLTVNQMTNFKAPSWSYGPSLLYPPPVRDQKEELGGSGPHVSPSEHVNRSIWDNMPRSYIVAQNSKDLFCRICDCVIYGHASVDEHINSERHRDTVNEFCVNITMRDNDTYDCKKCALEIVGRNDLYVHLAKHTADKGNNAVTSTYPNTTAVTNQSPHCADTCVILFNRREYCCKVCRDVILQDRIKIETHLASAGHVESFKRHGNKPYNEDNPYRCIACRCAIPNFANVPPHLNGQRHKSSLASLNGGAVVDKSLPNDWRELKLHHVFANADDSYYCRLCNRAMFSRPQVDEHIAGDLHSSNYDKYACGDLYFFDNKRIKCSYCDCIMPDDEVLYVHILAKRHLDNVALKRSKTPAARVEKITEPVVTVEPIKMAEPVETVEPIKMPEPVKVAEPLNTSDTVKSVTQSASDDYERLIEMMMKSDCGRADGLTERSTAQSESETMTSYESPSLASSTANLSKISLREPGVIENECSEADSLCQKDFDSIYDFTDRTRYYDESKKLLVFRDSGIYCIACKCTLEEYPENYMLHVRLDTSHCKALKVMIENDEPSEKFNNLRLVDDYLEKHVNRTTVCHVCDVTLENSKVIDHLAEPAHRERRDAQREKLIEMFKNAVLEKPDWYAFETYICFLCNTTFTSEVLYAFHLKRKHPRPAATEINFKRSYLHDFCLQCCTLWYGDVGTYALHCYDTGSTEHCYREPRRLKSLLGTTQNFLLMYDRFEAIYDPRFTARVGHGANILRDIVECCNIEQEYFEIWTLMSDYEHGMNIVNEIYFDHRQIGRLDIDPQTNLTNVMSRIEASLLLDPALWMKEKGTEIGTSSSPCLRMIHVPSRQRCDMYFEDQNNLTFERFSRIVMGKCSIVGKLVGFLQAWLDSCYLVEEKKTLHENIFCYVLMFLQQKFQFPKVSDLIYERKGVRFKNAISCGIGEIQRITEMHKNWKSADVNFPSLLMQFFAYYSRFDFRCHIVSPYAGRPISKLERTKNFTEAIHFGVPIGTENPIDRMENFAHSLDKAYAAQFRRYCAESFAILEKVAKE